MGPQDPSRGTEKAKLLPQYNNILILSTRILSRVSSGVFQRVSDVSYLHRVNAEADTGNPLSSTKSDMEMCRNTKAQCYSSY